MHHQIISIPSVHSSKIVPYIIKYIASNKTKHFWLPPNKVSLFWGSDILTSSFSLTATLFPSGPCLCHCLERGRGGLQVNWPTSIVKSVVVDYHQPDAAFWLSLQMREQKLSAPSLKPSSWTSSAHIKWTKQVNQRFSHILMNVPPLCLVISVWKAIKHFLIAIPVSLILPTSFFAVHAVELIFEVNVCNFPLITFLSGQNRSQIKTKSTD